MLLWQAREVLTLNYREYQQHIAQIEQAKQLGAAESRHTSCLDELSAQKADRDTLHSDHAATVQAKLNKAETPQSNAAEDKPTALVEQLEISKTAQVLNDIHFSYDSDGTDRPIANRA